MYKLLTQCKICGSIRRLFGKLWKLQICLLCWILSDGTCSKHGCRQKSFNKSIGYNGWNFKENCCIELKQFKGSQGLRLEFPQMLVNHAELQENRHKSTFSHLIHHSCCVSPAVYQRKSGVTLDRSPVNTDTKPCMHSLTRKDNLETPFNLTIHAKKTLGRESNRGPTAPQIAPLCSLFFTQLDIEQCIQYILIYIIIHLYLTTTAFVENDIYGCSTHL